ncbi:hypothetical protein [Demequina aurantiaca]|uniref:hypothetical protein n=1 Tax=Demequina aurantiaca TaxID=676200 RepID=UPI003D337900
MNDELELSRSYDNIVTTVADLSGYEFPFIVSELPDCDRAVLAAVVNGSDGQRAAIAGPRAAEHVAEAKSVIGFVNELYVVEPPHPSKARSNGLSSLLKQPDQK